VRARLAAVSGAAVVLSVLAIPSSEAAVSAQVAETGWWTQRPGATAKEGQGFEAAAALGSEQSVAALRVVVSGGEATTATLTLEEAGGVGQDAAVLRVCTTTKPWKQANPGPYGEAPEESCGQSADLTRGDDGTWTADIGILLGPAETSLVIVPDTAGPNGLPVGPGYQVDFSKATVKAAGGGALGGGLTPPGPESDGADDVEALDGGSADDGSGDDTAFGSDPGSAPEPGMPGGGSGEPSLDTSTPVPGAPGDAAAGGGAPSDAGAIGSEEGGAGGGGDSAEADADQPVGAVESLASGPVASDGSGGQPWGRLVFLLPLCALLGAGVAFGRPWLRDRGLGGFLSR
jgi:hypothetical protein